MHATERIAVLQAQGWHVEPDPGGRQGAWSVQPPDASAPFVFFGDEEIERFWRDLVMGAFVAERRAQYLADLCLSGRGPMADNARAWLHNPEIGLTHELQIESASVAAMPVPPDPEMPLPDTRWPPRVGYYDLRRMASELVSEAEGALLSERLPMGGVGRQRRL
jgi:hypothetical protein